MFRRVQLSVFAILCLLATSAFGATRYVTDELQINLRSGTGNQYRIIRMLETGTRIETLETTGEWTRVRAADAVGWVRTQYLSPQRPAADRLADTQAQLADAREQVSALEASLRESRSALDSARAQAEKLATTTEALQQKIGAAKEGLKLSQENVHLRKREAALEGHINALRSEVSDLTTRNDRAWFMVGAGVLFAGVLSGIIVTRIPWRRRNRMFQ